MRKPFVTLLLALLALIPPGLFAASPPPVVAVVQEATANGNDATMTFGSAWGASNHVLVAVWQGDQVSTEDLTGISVTETVIAGPVDLSGLRGYLFCFAGDGSDNTVVITTSGSATVRAAGIEVSGATCTEDGSEQSNTDTASPYPLTTDVTTTQDGSILFGIVRSNTAADFTASTATTSIPADGTDINGEALGGYQITTTAGAYELVFTSAAPETTVLLVGAVKAAAVVATKPQRLLLGVGRPR